MKISDNFFIFILRKKMLELKRKRKEEYEIDPNSSFSKIRRLQMTLKEEVALTDIFFENRDDLLKKNRKKLS